MCSLMSVLLGFLIRKLVIFIPPIKSSEMEVNDIINENVQNNACLEQTFEDISYQLLSKTIQTVLMHKLKRLLSRWVGPWLVTWTLEKKPQNPKINMYP